MKNAREIYSVSTAAGVWNMDIYSIDDLALVMGCSRRTILNWRKERGLPWITLGRKVYFRRDDIAEWCLKNRKISGD